MATVPQLKKDFSKTLHKLSHSHHPTQIFSDWLEISAIALHQLPFKAGDFSQDNEDYQRLEQIYLDRVKPYSHQELNTMSHMMGMVLMMCSTELNDHLGQIAGENELLNQHGGQFFTPFPVALMMAQMQLGNAHEILERQGIITIADPAVGAGSCLIAAAKALYEQNIDARSAAQFDAIDVSRNAFNMAYIQLSAMDLQAVVRHGNTLSGEMFEHRPTPQLRYFNQHLKEQLAISRMKQLFTDPASFFAADDMDSEAQTTAETVQADKGQPLETPIQQSLFGSESFTGTDLAKSKKQNEKADIVLPTANQLGLFSEGRESSL